MVGLESQNHHSSEKRHGGTVRGDPGPRHAGGLASRFSMILSVASLICEDGKCLLLVPSCSWHSCSVLAKVKVGTLEMDGSSVPARAQHCRPGSRMTR